jgi:uncharacterized protein YcgL (UPF0745 family)
MQCFVYKSLRKADTYVFFAKRDGFDVLPAPIAETLGKLVWVMDLELTPERKLAREDAAVVIANIERRGFHLQLPPPETASDSAPPEK